MEKTSDIIDRSDKELHSDLDGKDLGEANENYLLLSKYNLSYYPEYELLRCNTCANLGEEGRSGIIVGHNIGRHMRTHKIKLPASEVRILVQNFWKPESVYHQASRSSLPALSFLPVHSGFGCTECTHYCADRNSMNRHFRAKHPGLTKRLLECRLQSFAPPPLRRYFVVEEATKPNENRHKRNLSLSIPSIDMIPRDKSVISETVAFTDAPSPVDAPQVNRNDSLNGSGMVTEPCHNDIFTGSSHILENMTLLKSAITSEIGGKRKKTRKEDTCMIEISKLHILYHLVDHLRRAHIQDQDEIKQLRLLLGMRTEQLNENYNNLVVMATADDSIDYKAQFSEHIQVSEPDASQEDSTKRNNDDLEMINQVPDTNKDFTWERKRLQTS